MADELKIWALGDGNEAEAVASVASVKLESRLEETLVRRPEMLETGLHLVGRQTPTEGGPLDLLGVDAGGRLVVYELKREKLTREAVTQCIDYASALDTMTPEELAAFIAEHSGRDGIDKIENFTEWYQERFAGNNLSVLLPPRLVLVGLGVNEQAERMARFLSEGGIDIAVLTFYGFQHGGETLLGRQVEVVPGAQSPQGRRGGNDARQEAEREAELRSLLNERGLIQDFDAILDTIQVEVSNVQRPSFKTKFTVKLTMSIIGENDKYQHREFCRVFVRDSDPSTIYIGLPRSSEERYGEEALALLHKEPTFREQGSVFVVAADPWETRREAIVTLLRSAEKTWLEQRDAARRRLASNS